MLIENILRNMKDVDGLRDDNNKVNYNIFIIIEKNGNVKIKIYIIYGKVKIYGIWELIKYENY